MENILLIELNDWTQHHTKKESEIFDKCMDRVVRDPDIFFNYTISHIDMAGFVLITTTERDLKSHGLEGMMRFSEKRQHPDNCWRKYKPENIADPTKNGLPLPYDFDEAVRLEVFMSITKNGYEILTNEFTFQYDPEKYADRIPEKQVLEFGLFTGFDKKMNPIFDDNFLYLPNGFIERMTGKKPEYGDKPVLLVPPREFDELDIWKE